MPVLLLSDSSGIFFFLLWSQKCINRNGIQYFILKLNLKVSLRSGVGDGLII